MFLPFPAPDQISAVQDPVTRRDTLAWIRSEFERNRHITDIVRTFFSLQNIPPHHPRDPHPGQNTRGSARASPALPHLDLLIASRHLYLHSYPA